MRSSVIVDEEVSTSDAKVDIDAESTSKTTSAMSSRKICSIINAELEQKNILDCHSKPLEIHRSTVCAYLKEFYGKPKKIRKAFFDTFSCYTRSFKISHIILEQIF